RHARISRRHRQNRHYHRHPRQGPRRRQRRLHERPQRNHCLSPPALAPLSVLQHPCSLRRRRLAQSPRTSQRLHRTARQTRVKHTIFSGTHVRPRFHHHPGNPSHRPCHARRRRPRGPLRRRHARPRRLCHRLFLSRSPPRQSPHPHPNLRRPLRGRSQIRRRTIRRRKD